MAEMLHVTEDTFKIEVLELIPAGAGGFQRGLVSAM